MLNIRHIIKGVKTMDYKKAYFILFNTITDVIEIIENGIIFPNTDDAINKLKLAQQATEEMYIENL